MDNSAPLTGAGQGESAVWDQTWAELKSPTGAAAQRLLLPHFWLSCYCDEIWRCVAADLPAGEFLEQGAGRGYLSLYLSKRGRQVTMLDLSETGFELARRQCQDQQIPVPKFIRADARQTGLPSDSYDCIYNVGLLEHFDDPGPVIAEAVRLLKPGGKLFLIIVPTLPTSHQWLSKLIFCPWKLMPSGLKDRIKQLLRPNSASAPASADMTRTELGPTEYLACLTDLPVKDARCIPYNSYHDVYKHGWAKKYWQLPWYRLHHWIKQRLVSGPALQTAESLCCCYLLTAEKQSPAETPR